MWSGNLLFSISLHVTPNRDLVRFTDNFFHSNVLTSLYLDPGSRFVVWSSSFHFG